jgi:enoyl-CoA hydratase
VSVVRGREYGLLRVERLGAVLRVTLDRPECRNALSEALLGELLGVVRDAERDGEIGVLILRGAGKDFCAGYDVSPSSQAPARPSPHERMQAAARAGRVFDRLWRSSLATIVQIHGHCLAAGTDLALSCDLLVCSLDATIGYPAVRSMGVPETHMWLYHLGPQWTKRLLLTGDSISGAKAAELGLVLEAVESNALEEHVLALATRMSRISCDLLAANKYVVNRGLELMGRTLLQDVAVAQDVLARFAPGADTFATTAAARGLRQAIAERDGPFADGDPIA